MERALSTPPALAPAATRSSSLAGIVLLAMALSLLVWQGLPLAGVVLDSGTFLALHALAEVFAVVVAALVFFTGFNPLEARPSARGLLLSGAFLAVALLDVLHTVSFQGMPDFVNPNTPHKAILFWLAARLVAAFALLAYVLLPDTPVDGRRGRALTLAAALGFTLLVAWLGLVRPDLAPPMFEAGVGLSAAKIALEWLVILVLVATALLIHRRPLADMDRSGLVLAVLFMAVAELFFTVYTHVNDLANLLGHLFKVAGYVYLYRAVFLENVLQPVSRLRLAERRHAESRLRLLQLLENAPDAVLVSDGEGRIRFVNARLERMFGYPREDLLDQPVEILVPERLRAGHRQSRDAFLTREGGALWVDRELSGRRRDGDEFPVDISLSHHRVDGETQVVAFIRDVTERRQGEARLRYLATHDELTGLPNRLLFGERLETALAQARRDDSGGALLLLDLDHFQQVNGSLGHEYGDWFLQALASRMRDLLPAEAFMARFNGDEFALLLPGADAGRAGEVAGQLLASLREPMCIEGYEIAMGASIGAVLYPMDGDRADTLLRHAELARGRAKAEGRGCLRYYHPAMSGHIQRRLRLLGRLRHALERDEFSLHYQPRVALDSGAIVGWEALLRWHSAEEGPVSPADFIPVAEESGLIVPLGDWVLRTACRQLADWRGAGLAPGAMAVNLSARQFHGHDLPARVAAILAECGLPAEALELEITETAIMDDVAGATAILGQLKALGVKLAVDDFGTGHASLSYLKTFPVDTLKIDRSFVSGLPGDEDDAAIVRTVVLLGHTLGLELVAEGVETPEQLDFLRRQGCQQIQGYLYSRPLPVDAATTLLRQPPVLPAPAPIPAGA